MNATHTPTPWYCDNAAGTTIWNAAGHGLVAECPEPAEWLGAKKLDRAANAAFIVRACNAHDELVAALKFAKPIVGAVVAASSNETREQREKVYNKIVAALAKAGAA